MRIEVIINSNNRSLVITVNQEQDFNHLLKASCNKIRKQSTKGCSFIFQAKSIMDTNQRVSDCLQEGDKVWLLVSEKEKYQGPPESEFHRNIEAEGKVSIVANDEVYIEQEAVNQVVSMVKGAEDNIVKAVGMPDLHHGPTGVAVLAKQPIPKIPGYDIGCGMSLFATNIPASTSQDKIVRRMASMNIDQSEDPNDFYMGTLGGGNHFAELLRVDTNVAMDSAVTGMIDVDRLYLLVHSGSRGHGEKVFQAYVHEHQNTTIYMEQHLSLIDWAKRNRQTIAYRFLQQFQQHLSSSDQEEEDNGRDCDHQQPLIDIAHNYIERIPRELLCSVILPSTAASSSSSATSVAKDEDADHYYLHRKGAAPAYNHTFSLLPGSRGTASYILIGHGQPSQLFSLAHGAGRKLSRSDARQKHHNTAVDLTNGGSIICKNTDLLHEEAPYAYKDVEAVVTCMQSYDMCSIGARLLPVATYKTATPGG